MADPIKLAEVIGSMFIFAIPITLYVYYRRLRNRNAPSPVSKAALDDMKARGEPFVLVDVREKAEFAKSPRQEAVNIPLSEIPYDTADWNRDGLYVLVCAHGIRSKKGAMAMAGRGFRSVRFLEQ